ncbi:MAG: hypothetical protein E4G98_04995, partial [Promethearchaeota archaeon]
MSNSTSYRSWRVLITAIWGLLEEGILNGVSKLNQIWPGYYSYFMRFLHGKFGATIVVFDQVLEQNPKHRQFALRTPWKKRNYIRQPHSHSIHLQSAHLQSAQLQSHQLQGTLQKGDMLILPTQEVLNLVLRSKVNSSVAECYCRKQTKKHGKICTIHAPLRTCLTLTFPQSLDTILDSPISPKLASHEQDLYNFFQRCEEIGLVHQVIWMPSSQFTYVICNCCPCCCVVLAPYLENQQKKAMHTQLIQLIARRYKIIQKRAQHTSISSPDRKKLMKQLK